MVDIFKGFGIEAVPGQGSIFDPNLHEAIMREPDNSLPEGTIIQEFRKGFRIGDKLIRAAMVKVGFPVRLFQRQCKINFATVGKLGLLVSPLYLHCTVYIAAIGKLGLVAYIVPTAQDVHCHSCDGRLSYATFVPNFAGCTSLEL
jgi:GrpE